MALPWRVRALGWAVRTAVGPYATISPAKRRVLQAHTGPAWLGHVLNGRPDPDATGTERAIPGPAGSVPTRVYRPRHRAGGLPVVVAVPGGGFTYSHPDNSAWLASRLCTRLPAVVLVPAHRRPPADPAPAAGEDCYAVTAWAAANAALLGGDGDRLAVVGESSGATLAAAVTLRARERGGPGIRAQALLQGTFDLTPSAPSMHAPVSWPFGRPRDLPDLARAYVGAGDPADPAVSPLLAESHAGLPPAFVLTADHDYLREETERYAAALVRDGVPVAHAHYRDSPHGIFSFPSWCWASGPALDRLVAFLRRRLSDS